MKTRLAMKTAHGAGCTFRPDGLEAGYRRRAVQTAAGSMYVCNRHHANCIKRAPGLSFARWILFSRRFAASQPVLIRQRGVDEPAHVIGMELQSPRLEW